MYGSVEGRIKHLTLDLRSQILGVDGMRRVRFGARRKKEGNKGDGRKKKGK